MEQEKSRGKNSNLIEEGNPRLLKRAVKSGAAYTLYLEYNYGKGHRRVEALPLRLMLSTKTAIDNQRNKDTLELAKRIRYERSQEFLQQREGYRLKKDLSVNFLSFYEAYIKNYSKKDIRVIEMALRDFKKYLADKYPYLSQRIEPYQMTKPMMENYAK